MGRGSLDAALWDSPSVLGVGVDLADEDIEGGATVDGVAALSPDGRSRRPSGASERRDDGIRRGGMRREGLPRGLGDATRAELLIVDGISEGEIDPRLAARYLVAPRRSAAAVSATALCSSNAAAALELGRHDLWRVWMVAACAVGAHDHAVPPRPMPTWPHPMPTRAHATCAMPHARCPHAHAADAPSS